jgi:hypothetical protein
MDVTSLRLILDWDMVMEHYVPGMPCGPSLEPESLPLSGSTVGALWTWHKRWSTLFLIPDDQGTDLLDREVDWRLLEREGLELWSWVRKELGPSYQVFFHSAIDSLTFATPEEYARAGVWLDLLPAK